MRNEKYYSTQLHHIFINLPLRPVVKPSKRGQNYIVPFFFFGTGYCETECGVIEIYAKW